MAVDLDALQRQVDRLEHGYEKLDGQVGGLAVSIRETDERFRVIIIGDLTTGSRDRSILGKLDADHRRLLALEKERDDKAEARKFWTREVFLVGIVAATLSGLAMPLLLKFLHLI